MSQSDLTDIVVALDRAVKEAFERGYRKGANDMRQQILEAANAKQPMKAAEKDIPAPEQSKQTVEKLSRSWPPGRVARGTVRRVLSQVMSDTEGQTIPEITGRAQALDPNISPTSIPNELRRQLGALYRQEGNNWFLMQPRVEKNSAGLAVNDSPAASQKRGDAHGPAIATPGSA